ncbi:MAG: hypothetical protein ACI3Z7_01840 [Candidatus Aphodosoma sp.]
MKPQIIPLLSAAVILLAGCRHGSRREADLRGLDFDVRIERFDSAFWSIDTTDAAAGMKWLASQYPGITEVYLENVIRFGHPDSAITHDTYRLFRNDTSVIRLYTDCLTMYSDVSDFNAQLTGAFRRARYFFPHIATPRLYAHVSGFNQSIVAGEGFISVSLDNYMGSDYPIYKLIDIYEYQRVNMTRDKVVPDYITGWLTSEYYPQAHGNLLDDILYRGKILYATATLLPDIPDHIIMGYTEEQWEWMQKYEPELWQLMLANRVLYETNVLTKGQYLNDGPFTLPFSQESPSRGGAYIGWRIVESYMANNRAVTLRQLMDQNDSQTILSRSNYRP